MSINSAKLLLFVSICVLLPRLCVQGRSAVGSRSRPSADVLFPFDVGVGGSRDKELSVKGFLHPGICGKWTPLIAKL